MNAVVRLENVTKSFFDKVIIKDLDLEILMEDF